MMHKPPPAPHWAFRWGGTARRAPTSSACAVRNLPGTACFATPLAALIEAAVAALKPPPLGGPYQCVLDTRRSHQEVGLLSSVFRWAVNGQHRHPRSSRVTFPAGKARCEGWATPHAKSKIARGHEGPRFMCKALQRTNGWAGEARATTG